MTDKSSEYYPVWYIICPDGQRRLGNSYSIEEAHKILGAIKTEEPTPCHATSAKARPYSCPGGEGHVLRVLFEEYDIVKTNNDNKAYTTEIKTVDGIEIKITRWENGGTKLESPCDCFGNKNRFHSTGYCPWLAKWKEVKHE